ncbi:MAG TPA: acyl-CoA dehydrogenase family protein [Rhodoblastus sp.]|nr:acyl-CoA dehydrogenase family protein [Rhodoblastus sp.]
MSSGETEDLLRMLRDSAADYVNRSEMARDVRAWRQKPEGYDAQRWNEMVQLGWVGLRAPEGAGGMGLGVAECVALLAETGRGIGPEPLSAIGVLAMRALVGGEGARNDDLMAGLADGGRVIAVAWQEKAGALHAGDCETRATPTANGWRLTGAKDYVHGAAQANGLIVSARAPEGVGLFYVERDAKGVKLETRFFTDGTTCHSLHLQDVEVAADFCIAPPGTGEAVLDPALDETRIAASAEMSGLSQRALDMTLDYLRQRKQFGKAIGSFQALQHRAVDLYVTTQMMRAAIDRAARAFEAADAREKALIASACKARCSDGALLIAKEAIQMHGAIGYTDEHDIGLFVRRAIKLAAWLGNGAQHRKRYAALSPALEQV